MRTDPEQAATYDYTRGASPTVVRSLSKHLGRGAGQSLLDIAGGTGNYAQVFQARGFRLLVVDREPAMLARAVPKIGPGKCMVGEAEALPIRDASVDRAMIVNALHYFADAPAALREARRVLREGPLALVTFTRENLAPLFVYEYFGDAWPEPPALAELAGMVRDAGFSRVEHEAFVYTDTADGTVPALHTDALRLAGPAYLRNTSLWHRVDEETRQAGLQALARDLQSGRLEERVRESLRLAVRHGHGTVLAAWP